MKWTHPTSQSASREPRWGWVNPSAGTVPIYRLAAITIGNDCHFHNVEAAVFPGDTRNILGLSALNKACPFFFY
jgi:hypothetical protein